MSVDHGQNPLDENRELTEIRDTDSERQETEKETKLGLSMLAKVALGVVVSVSLIISISCLMKFNQLEKERKELQAELEVYNKAIEELQYIINSPEDDEYIIAEAKKKLGLYFPDENIYYQDVND